ALNDKALRIRSIEKNEKKYTKITYKGPKLDKISKTREEIELEVENKDEMKKLFERLLFIESGHVKKIREIYEYLEKEDKNLENMKFEIAIDNVKGLGYYMEIETDLEDEKTEIAIEKIYKLFKELGIENGFERTSYLELLEKEN
ncbi:MAG: class IV adenylate cyclase, partial [Methanobrevibacter sp.]|nr:class IV adenylate cyclase [Methanobrevibacter sp.]